METINYIEFKKERDLGSIISDTFKFIRENWKSYFLTVIKITLPVLILFLLILGYYFYSLSGLFSNIDNDTIENTFSGLGMVSFAITYILLLFSGVALYVLMVMSSLYYIRSYINNGGTTDFNTIKANVFGNFWPFFGMSVLIFFIIIFSMFLCIFPVFYTGTVLALAAPILVFEGRGAVESISHSFTLIKDHFWATFGVLFVVGILVYILSLSFSIPSIIYNFIKIGTSLDEGDPTTVFSIFKDPIYVALYIFGYIGQFILQSVTIIATVFLYYDLNEQKNFTGTFEKIESLGQ